MVGNPIQVNSEEKIERELDYADPTLRFERFYGSQKSAMRAGNLHSLAGHVRTAGSANTVHQYLGDGTAIRFPRFAGGVLASWSADMRTPIAETTATAAGVVRWKISSLGEPRVDLFDFPGRTLMHLHAHGRSVTFTHVDATRARVPATAPACFVLVGGVRVPNEATPSTLQCVTDDFGRQLNFRYSVRTLDGFVVPDNLIQMIDPAGNVYQYAYDEANNLTTVTYPGGYRRLYHYNEPENTASTRQTHARTGITEIVPTFEPMRLSTFRYDTAGRAIYTERAGGVNAYSINYAMPGREVVITDPLGTQRTQSFSTIVGVERPTGATQPPGSGSSACSDTLTYDANGNVTSRVDFNGNKTCYAYDLPRNLQTKRVEALAATANCTTALSSPPAGARVITTQWHPDWRIQTRVAEPKRITTTTYNGQGATCAPVDALVDGRPIAVICSKSEQATTDESGAAGFGATPSGPPRGWSNTYTTYGRLLTATDPNAKTTTYTYHADNDPDLGKRGNVATITNAANHVTEYTDYNLHGQPTRIVDSNGLVTTNVYDVRLRLRSSTVGSEATLFDYHPAGHLTQATLPDSATLTYDYDGAHRLTSIQDQKGNRIIYTLNGLGARTGEEVRDPGGTLVKNIGRVVDALNRLEQVTGERQYQKGTQ
jgi:YD repeat-containing protein